MKLVKSKEKGFSLPEVLVALVVLGVITLAVMLVSLSSIRSNAKSRASIGAVAAAESWLDRFRAQSLDFYAFDDATPKVYDYKYNYANDAIFSVVNTTNSELINNDWQNYKFEIITSQFSTAPITWIVSITATYRIAGDEHSVVLKTLI